MGNDAPNVELTQFNKLAAKFGVKFNGETKGRVPVATNIFIKEYSSLTLSGDAKVILKDADGEAVISTTKYGKGTVFVIGDPWLYNEYVDGRKLPAKYENYKAATDLVIWLAQMAK
jgi:unsaturated rhamnogalacturonyl hydrolase